VNEARLSDQQLDEIEDIGVLDLAGYPEGDDSLRQLLVSKYGLSPEAARQVVDIVNSSGTTSAMRYLADISEAQTPMNDTLIVGDSVRMKDSWDPNDDWGDYRGEHPSLIPPNELGQVKQLLPGGKMAVQFANTVAVVNRADVVKEAHEPADYSTPVGGDYSCPDCDYTTDTKRKLNAHRLDIHDVHEPEEGVVVVAPARRLASATVTAREPTATYSAAEQSDLALSAKNIELLRQGSLLAATPLKLTAEDVFAGGKARLALLASDLLLSIAAAEYLSPIAMALSAPDAAKPVTQDHLEELMQLVSAVSDNGIGDGDSELKKALDHLSELACAAATEQFLASAERIYPNKRALMEDIYMLRALR